MAKKLMKYGKLIIHAIMLPIALLMVTGAYVFAGALTPDMPLVPNGALETIEVKVGAQASAYGNFLDLSQGLVYKKREAARASDKIHLMYAYGKNSKANLFFIGSNAIQKYARSVQELVNQWNNRQEGQIINIGKDPIAFEALSSAQEIAQLFHERRNRLFLDASYNMATQGPADALSQLSAGDVLLIHAFNSQTYMAVQILNLQAGAEGDMTLSIKGSDAVVESAEPMVQAAGGQWNVGQTYADSLYWSEYTVGDMPLVISVPHGGNMNPVEIPDRNCRNSVRGTDRYTVELARAIQKVFYEKYQMRPHIIVSNLSRRKIDHNRNVDPATCGNPKMQGAWQLYHNYIDTAIHIAGEAGNQVFFVDLHAHGHAIQRLELGYLIPSAGLKEVYDGENVLTHADKASVVNLLPESPKHRAAAFRDLFFGEQAFGTLMENAGIRAIPSKQDPYPINAAPYLSRGYNTQKFTSKDYPNVYGLQMECNLKGVRDVESRPGFASKFAEIALLYMELHKE